jgi:hypothetical protein
MKAFFKRRWFLLSCVIALLACSTVAEAVERRLITITARPQFKYDQPDIVLIVTDGKAWAVTGWGKMLKGKIIPTYSFDLDKKTTYTFTLEEVRNKFSEVYVSPVPGGTIGEGEDHIVKSHQLARVTRGKRTLFDWSICEVHQRKMARKAVPVSRIAPSAAASQPSEDEEKTLFPHRREYVEAIGAVRERKTDLVHVCPDCVAAHKKWLGDKQPAPKSAKPPG